MATVAFPLMIFYLLSPFIALMMISSLLDGFPFGYMDTFTLYVVMFGLMAGSCVMMFDIFPKPIPERLVNWFKQLWDWAEN